MKTKQYLILGLDIVYLWYASFFFRHADTLFNIAGVVIALTLGYLTYKFFKK